jgi:antitoxin YobK
MTQEETYQKIRDLIEEHQKEHSFAKGVSLSTVQDVEELLSVKLPEDYIWFLQHYGEGHLFGSSILGISELGAFSVVKETLDCRRWNMPRNFIVIMNCDEFHYCLDTESGKIMNWSKHESGIYPRQDSFLEFFLDEIENAIDNMHD